MTVINENVQNTINTSMDSSNADVNTPADSHVNKSSQPEERPAVASTAAGMPAPAPVVNALQERNKNQEDKELPGTGSTATGLPNPAAVEDAEKEKESTSSSSSSSDSDSLKENTGAPKKSKRKESKRQSLKKAVDTVAHAPATAAHKVIKKVTPSKSADAPSSDSTSSDQQQQQHQSEAAVDNKQEKGEHKDAFVGSKQEKGDHKDASISGKQDKDSSEAVKAAIVSTAENGAIDTTACLSSNATPIESEAVVPQSTHTPIDRISETQTAAESSPGPTVSEAAEPHSTHTPIGCQAVVPVAENLPVPFESAQEPVVEEAVIEKPPVCPTPADIKSEDRAVSEVPAATEQVSLSQVPMGNVEQRTSVGGEGPTKMPLHSELAPNDVKTEHTRAAEEPVKRNDIKATEPVKNDTAVNQISVPVNDDVKTEPVQQNKPTSDGPSDVKKVNDGSTGVKTDEKPTVVKPEDKPTDVKPTDVKSTDVNAQDKLNDTTTQDKPTNVKATTPQQPSTQATTEPKPRGISSTQPATNSKELPPQPSTGTGQPKGTTGSKDSPCTVM